MATDQPHVLIIGAGVTGLLLAQSLKRHSIPFTVFERDPYPHHRGKGWGLTIHWALQNLLDLLPESVIERLPETYVDPEAVRNGENGNFLFFNLRNGEALWKVPPNKRMRVAREKLRALLMEGVEVKWGHTFDAVSTLGKGEVTATFTTADSETTQYRGTLLVGCDGTRSQMRKSLFPGSHQNYILPVRLLGVSTVYPSSLAMKARNLDPFFYQAGDPETDAFHWFSFLDSPSNNDREDWESYECQILVSWPYRAGFMGREMPLDVPEENGERLQIMNEVAEGWAEPFREIVMGISEGTEVKTISLEDWVPPKEGWKGGRGDGKVVLVGDAAHAMTMFRGEAANHGIMDVAVLLDKILPALKSEDTNPDALKSGLRDYSDEMVTRTRPAVLNSRQACLDAHNYKAINDESPLIKRRVAVLEEN